MNQDSKRHIPLQKLVNHDTHRIFLVCEVNQGVQGVILCSCKFCKISKNTFFIEHLWATASVKIKVQVKIMTSK